MACLAEKLARSQHVPTIIHVIEMTQPTGDPTKVGRTRDEESVVFLEHIHLSKLQLLVQ